MQGETLETVTETLTTTQRLLQNMNDGLVKDALSKFLPDAFAFLWAVIFALITYVVGRKIMLLILKIIQKSMEKHDVDTGVRQFVNSVVKVILYVFLLICILNIFGIETSSVAAGVASLGLTAGLALQGSLSNFAGGVLILVLHPFVVGDYIIEDTHGNEGTVTEITIFYTKLRTIDNKLIVIPNGTLANNSLTNATHSDRRQIDLTVSIGYDDDIKKAKKILEDLVSAEPRRFKDMDTNIFVKELAASSVELGMRFWVPTTSYWNIRWDMLEKVKYAFDENGITIPFQQVDVNMKEDR